MRSFAWKIWLLVLALGVLLALGAFAEGTLSLASACVCTLGGCFGVRHAWAKVQQAERRAAARRRAALQRRTAPAAAQLRCADTAPAAGGQGPLWVA